MKERPLISIVVPVFNEEESLSSLVARTNRVFERLGSYAWNYIFVNDGSTDNTQAVLERMKQEVAQLRVIRHRRACGQSQAVTTGVR
ncbi:MAG: glycosyltransferase [Gammaproteobacteria bacterium]